MLPLRDNLPTDRFPVLTVVLIAINVIVFGWQLTLGDEDYSSAQLKELEVSESDQAAIEYGAIPYRLTHPGEECGATTDAQVACEGTPLYEDAQQAGLLAPLADAPWWVTVFTSMFMHGSILHIAGNMLFLWVFGNNIEDSMGRPKFLAFYLLSGVVAVYAQTLLEPDATVPTIGASGAVAGVLGGYILLHPHARVLTLDLRRLLHHVHRGPGDDHARRLVRVAADPGAGAGGDDRGRRRRGRRRLPRPPRRFRLRPGDDQALGDAKTRRSGRVRPTFTEDGLMDPDLRTMLLALGAIFVFAFGAMTLVVISESGLDVLTVTSLAIVALVAFGLYGAWRNPPD